VSRRYLITLLILLGGRVGPKIRRKKKKKKRKGEWKEGMTEETLLDSCCLPISFLLGVPTRSRRRGQRGKGGRRRKGEGGTKGHALRDPLGLPLFASAFLNKVNNDGSTGTDLEEGEQEKKRKKKERSHPKIPSPPPSEK